MTTAPPPQRALRLALLVTIVIGAIVTIVIGAIVARHNTAEPRIALFTTLRAYHLKPMSCSEGYFQNIAVASWLEFADQIVLLIDDDSGCEHASRISPKITCRKHSCVHPMYGKPTMACLYAMGEALARYDTLMYTNPDIVYSGVQDTVRTAKERLGQFTIVGRRVGIGAEPLCLQRKISDYKQLIELGHRIGRPDPNGWAMDYFIYTRNSLPVGAMPPFLVGVWRWDNWLLGEVVRLGKVHVIDASATIAATHLGCTSTAHNNRFGANYSNMLWKATLPGGKPIPRPAGLGAMRYSSMFAVRHATHVELVLNKTAAMLVRGYVQQIRAAANAAGEPALP